jgi:hypothetical protein
MIFIYTNVIIILSKSSLTKHNHLATARTSIQLNYPIHQVYIFYLSHYSHFSNVTIVIKFAAKTTMQEHSEVLSRKAEVK